MNGKLTCMALKSPLAQQIAMLMETDWNDLYSDSVCSEIPILLLCCIKINYIQDCLTSIFFSSIKNRLLRICFLRETVYAVLRKLMKYQVFCLISLPFPRNEKKNLIHHLNIMKLFNMPYTILLQTVDVAFYWQKLLLNLQIIIYGMELFPQLMISGLFQIFQKYHFTLWKPSHWNIYKFIAYTTFACGVVPSDACHVFWVA